MRKIIDLFIKNRILTNWLMLLIFIAGTFGLMNLKKRIWPPIEFDWVSVDLAWPGASAREIEEAIIQKVEGPIMGLQGVATLEATAGDGWAYFGLETEPRTDMTKLKEKIQETFDSMSDYPEDARPPNIYQETEWSRVMLLFIYGEEDQDPALLEAVSQEFKEDLLNTGEASEIRMWGFPREDILIEIDPLVQQQYGISMDEIAQRIRMNSLNASSGSIVTGSEQIELRQYEKKTDIADLESVPVTLTEEGRVLTLGDVADIRRSRSSNSIYTQANGRNGIGMNIMYSPSEDVVALGKVCDELIAEYEERYQGLLHFNPYIRDVDQVSERLGTLMTSGLMGLLLVLIVLGLFLNLRLSFWVAMGIPISFFGLLFMEWILGITINEMSLFGMIMVIGILVDDGIVIGENIFRHIQELGKSPAQAALDGTMEVIAPITVSIMTTVIAFAPYFFLYGDMGKYTSEIGKVVIISLLFSLVEALILLPAHLAHNKRRKEKTESKFRSRIDGFQKRMIHNGYRPLLEKSLNNRVLVLLLLGVSIMIITGAFMGNRIRAEFFPELESPFVYIEANFPAGTTADDMNSVRKDLENRSLEFGKNYARPTQGYDNGIVNYLSWRNGDAVIVYLLLIPNEYRDFTVKEFGRDLNQHMQGFSELESLIVGEDSIFGGDPISIRFLGKDQENLVKAGELFKEELRSIDGVKDIRDDLPLGNREVVFNLNAYGRALGLSEAALTRQVQSGFSGIEVLKIQEGPTEVPVMLRYPEDERDSLKKLEDLPVRTPGGQWLTLKEVADFSLQQSLQRIRRQDGYRSLRVSAGLDTGRNDLNVVMKKINEEMVPHVLAQVEGVSVSQSGQAEAMDKMVKSMIFSMVTALLFMFTLLMFQMRSYGQTITVLALIPLGIIGAVLGHGIVGIPLSFVSFLGCIALGGIIVNDSVVLIDGYNRRLKEGEEPRQAIINTAVQRFRPILMTTLTTSIGLAPLIFQKSEGGQLLIPIAVSISFGLLFGTFLTLVVLPSLLSLMTEAKIRRQNRRKERELMLVTTGPVNETPELQRKDA